MAEETAMLDVLSNGRLRIRRGPGPGGLRYNNFKVQYDSRTQRFQEIVDIILGLWSTAGLPTTANTTVWTTWLLLRCPCRSRTHPMYLAVSRTPGSVEVAV